MKHNLNIILIALRLVIVVAACMAGYNFICCGFAFVYPDNALLFLNHNFTPYNAALKYGNSEAFFMPYYLACYGLLLTYFTRVLINLRKCFVKLKKGEIFYEEQARQFKRTGEGIIIFAKCRYVLVCAFGCIFFRAFQFFATEIPVFLLLYLMGKLVLVVHHIAEKGTFIQQENDLTI